MIVDWSEAPEWANYLAVSELGHSTWCELMPRLCETRNNWEGGGRWTISNLKLVDQSTRLVQKSSVWTGEGLPPVGTVCEYLGAHQYNEWSEVKIFGAWRNIVFVDFTDGWRQEDNPARFRPIRTPEQIAAEEREKTIDELKEVFDSISNELCPTSNQYLETLFGAIHDAGYRKQVSE